MRRRWQARTTTTRGDGTRERLVDQHAGRRASASEDVRHHRRGCLSTRWRRHAPGKSAGDGDALGDVMSPGAAPQDPEAAARFSPDLVRSLRDTIGRRRTVRHGILGTFGEVDCGVPIGTSSRSLTKTARTMTRAVSHPRRSKLARGCAALSENQLPCEAGSSIFLRHDPDRFDRMRAVITGPGGRRTAAVVSCLTFTRRATPKSLRW